MLALSTREKCNTFVTSVQVQSTDTSAYEYNKPIPAAHQHFYIIWYLSFRFLFRFSKKLYFLWLVWAPASAFVCVWITTSKSRKTYKKKHINRVFTFQIFTKYLHRNVRKNVKLLYIYSTKLYFSSFYVCVLLLFICFFFVLCRIELRVVHLVLGYCMFHACVCS